MTLATFKYKVRDKFGKAVNGVMTGEAKESVARHLESMGYAPIAIEEVKAAPFIASRCLSLAGRIGFKKVGLEEINLFTRQLVTLQRAGVPLLLSLDALEQQTRNNYFKCAIRQIMADIEAGNSFSAVLSNHPDIFNELYVNMVRAGESGGTLDDMLERLAQLGEDELLMRSRVSSAMRYPIIVVVTLACAFFVLVGFVLPRFADLFSGFKVPLPLPTKILLGMSVIIKRFWIPAAIVFTAAIFAFLNFINGKTGRPLWDNLKLRVFIFGSLILMITMSRFSRVTAILLKSGLPILHILDLVKKTVGNVIVERAIEHIRLSVAEGKGISEPMKVSRLFPPMVVQMVAIGEETGKIDELLLRTADYYDSRIDYTLKNLTTLIEPILIFFLGLMVLAMSLAIFLPMWNMVQLFKR